MTSMELEAYKAELACEILTTDSRQVLDEVKRLLTKLSKKTKKKEETISKEEILAGIDAGLKDIKAKYPDIDVVVGNIETSESFDKQAKRLQKHYASL